jgi:hypothetical protein
MNLPDKTHNEGIGTPFSGHSTAANFQVLQIYWMFVVNYIENDRIKANLEVIRESNCMHKIRTTGCSSAERGRKTCYQG